MLVTACFSTGQNYSILQVLHPHLSKWRVRDSVDKVFLCFMQLKSAVTENTPKLFVVLKILPY